MRAFLFNFRWWRVFVYHVAVMGEVSVSLWGNIGSQIVFARDDYSLMIKALKEADKGIK